MNSVSETYRQVVATARYTYFSTLHKREVIIFAIASAAAAQLSFWISSRFLEDHSCLETRIIANKWSSAQAVSIKAVDLAHGRNR